MKFLFAHLYMFHKLKKIQLQLSIQAIQNTHPVQAEVHCERGYSDCSESSRNSMVEKPWLRPSSEKLYACIFIKRSQPRCQHHQLTVK